MSAIAVDLAKLGRVFQGQAHCGNDGIKGTTCHGDDESEMLYFGGSWLDSSSCLRISVICSQSLANLEKEKSGFLSGKQLSQLCSLLFPFKYIDGEKPLSLHPFIVPVVVLT